MAKPSHPYEKLSPKVLRQRTLAVWAALDAARIYVPPLEENAQAADTAQAHTAPKRDKFSLERHGHGRGNTKSIKRRRRKETKETLGRLLVHLEELATLHNVHIETTEGRSD